MNNLVLLNPGGEPFVPADVRDVLHSIKGMHDMREGQFIGSVLDCEYDFGAASTIVRLGEDLKTIELTGVNDASLSAALEIQQRVGRPLRLFDLAYSFDTLLRGSQTLEELRELVSDDE